MYYLLFVASFLGKRSIVIVSKTRVSPKDLYMKSKKTERFIYVINKLM